MTVGELIRKLEQFDEGTQVRIASHAFRPFEYTVGPVESALVCREGERVHTELVFISEGHIVDYLPDEACAELGWERE